MGKKKSKPNSPTEGVAVQWFNAPTPLFIPLSYRSNLITDRVGLPGLKSRLETTTISNWSPAENQSDNVKEKWFDPTGNQLGSRWHCHAATQLGNTYNFQLVTSWRADGVDQLKFCYGPNNVQLITSWWIECVTIWKAVLSCFTSISLSWCNCCYPW